METKDVILKLRTERGLSQDELAEKVFVTRQAVSRWENGETLPNTETLKLLSNLFGVSINTLLGSPHPLYCQCCGMPLEDGILSHNEDGSINEDYCQWCFADGTYTYDNMDDLIEVCIPHMAKEGFSEADARAFMKESLPRLKYWKNHDELSDKGKFDAFKKTLVDEINALGIEGMPKVTKLSALVGRYVNIEYPMPNGGKAKFLNDDTTYLGTQLESEIEEGRCFGIVANVEFILICTYGQDGVDPKLILYRKR